MTVLPQHRYIKLFFVRSGMSKKSGVWESHCSKRTKILWILWLSYGMKEKVIKLSKQNFTTNIKKVIKSQEN